MNLLLSPRGLGVLLLLGTLQIKGGTKIYWTETRSGGESFVMRANVDGSNPEAIVSGADRVKGPNGLEYGGGFLLWPDQQLGAVLKVRPDGTEYGVFAPSNSPYDVVIKTDRAFWTSLTGDSIDASGAEGSGAARFLSSPDLSSPFAIDATDANVYWSEARGSGRIRRSDPEGGNIVTVVEKTYTYDMQIVGGFLYFGDNNFPAAMKRANLDGSNPVTLWAVNFVNGIWVTPDAIYWSDLFSINKASLTGGDQVTVYTPLEAGTQVRGVVVLEEATQPTAPTIGDARIAGTDFVFTVQGEVGKTVYVEKAASASPAMWDVATSFTGSGQPVNVTNQISQGRRI